MTSNLLKYKNNMIRVSRCGYTGEDGFEVSIPHKITKGFVEHLQE